VPSLCLSVLCATLLCRVAFDKNKKQINTSTKLFGTCGGLQFPYTILTRILKATEATNRVKYCANQNSYFELPYLPIYLPATITFYLQKVRVDFWPLQLSGISWRRVLADITWFKGVGLSTYVIVSFILFHSTVAPIILLCSKAFFSPKVFCLSPPLGLVTHFYFPLPFSPSWLPSASLLLCLFALFVASVAPMRFWVSLTDRCCGRSAALLHGQHHTWTRSIKHVCGGFPPDRPVSPGNFCPSAPLAYPPPC
jgi:hypothetical protein